MYHTPDGMKLFERMSREVPADDSASVAEKMLLYWLLRDMKPETVIETGTHRGLTSLYMAHALMDNQKGHLYTADPFEWGQRANFDKFPEMSDRITFFKTEGRQMIDTLDKIDFAFIDGYHEVKDVVPEIENLLPRLTSGAIVIFHDCWYGNTDGVNEAMEQTGLQSVWLPTTNAIRIYQHTIDKPKGRDEIYQNINSNTNN